MVLPPPLFGCSKFLNFIVSQKPTAFREAKTINKPT